MALSWCMKGESMPFKCNPRRQHESCHSTPWSSIREYSKGQNAYKFQK